MYNPKTILAQTVMSMHLLVANCGPQHRSTVNNDLGTKIKREGSRNMTDGLLAPRTRAGAVSFEENEAGDWRKRWWHWLVCI